MQLRQTCSIEALLDLQDVRVKVRPPLHLVKMRRFRIRQCVGEKNYKYFVSFLFLHAIWCLYLAVIGAVSLIEYLDRIHFYSMRFQMEGRIVTPDGLLALQVSRT